MSNSGLEVYTRVAFCQRCYDEGRPKIKINPETLKPFGDWFIVYAGTRGKYFANEAKRKGKRGFVPTFFAKVKVVGGEVYFDKACGIHGCGITIGEMTPTGIKWEFIKERIQSGKMRIVDWNALIKMSSDPQWFI